MDPSSPEPAFAQLVRTVKIAVATRRLEAGDRLPSVRDLARELVINPNTVARAYRAFEAEGVTVSRQGSGAFVADRRVVVRRGEQKRRLREGLGGLLADAVHLGHTEADVCGEFDEALGRFRFRPAAGEGDA